jgi:DNA-binding CsgD family transcriptional regulator
MSKSKLFVTQLDTGSRSYYVREVGRTMKVLGPLFETAEEAFELLHKCEQDEEFAYWQRVYALNSVPNPREDTRNMTDMTKTEGQVLDYLFSGFDTECCVQTFKSLSNALGITERQAKTACRRLKRRGLTEHSPYWSFDDNRLGGSGYTLTVAGIGEGRVRQRASTATSETAGSRATAALTA